jgi:hypothetical protein
MRRYRHRRHCADYLYCTSPHWTIVRRSYSRASPNRGNQNSAVVPVSPAPRLACGRGPGRARQAIGERRLDGADGLHFAYAAQTWLVLTRASPRC